MRHWFTASLLLTIAVDCCCPVPVQAQSDCTFKISHFGRTPKTSAELIQLQSKFIDPQFPVTQQFIRELATQESREESLGRPPRATSRADRSVVNFYAQKQGEFSSKYLDLLTNVLPQKQGEAQITSFETIIENQFLRGSPISSEAQQCLQQAAEDIFPSLPFETQWAILFRGNYSLFGSPALTSYLQRLYESLEQHVKSDPESADPSSDRERNLRFYRTGMLKRIYEADPSIGRQIILGEIAAELPRADIEALKLLPDVTLPEMDSLFSKQLPAVYENSDWDEYNAKLGVIERYATVATLPAMKTLYLHDPDDRNQYHDTLFFSYFLRTDQAFGRQLMEAELSRSHSNCSIVVFTEMAGVRHQPELREIAKEHLDNPDKCVAGNAAYSFVWMGNKGVEDLLWRHLEAWHKEWAGKNGPIPYPEQAYEDSLVEALLFGNGPCEPRDTVERLRPLYIKGKSVDGNISFPPWHDPVRIEFASSADGPLLFSVDSCSGRINVAQLEAAIPGFPAQTEFEWYGSANSGLQSVIEPARIEIERIIKQQGMSFHIHTDN
jgi:hypothetical protein